MKRPVGTNDRPGPGTELVEGFPVRLDLAYDPATRTWLEHRGEGRVRVGIDPLEVEASGTVAALSLVPPGTRVGRGEMLGSLEAEKFVGPLSSPVSGTVEAVNEDLLSNPGALDRDPYAAWLVEIDADGLPPSLVEGAEEVRSWFGHAVGEYRRKGVLAE